ncbi:MAG: hypothetical protein K5677_09735 [Ruminococcus sp.]|nr:hypothetical protein [Ruminococcus sp.]
MNDISENVEPGSLSMEELRTMPPEMKSMYRQMIENGLLATDLAAKLNRAFNIK